MAERVIRDYGVLGSNPRALIFGANVIFDIALPCGASIGYRGWLLENLFCAKAILNPMYTITAILCSDFNCTSFLKLRLENAQISAKGQSQVTKLDRHIEKNLPPR